MDGVIGQKYGGMILTKNQKFHEIEHHLIYISGMLYIAPH